MNEPVTEQAHTKDFDDKVVPVKKGAFIFTAFIFGLCLAIGCAHFFFQHRYLSLLQMAGFLFLGCMYAGIMQRKSSLGNEVFSYALFVTLALLITIGVASFFKSVFQLVELITLGAAFILPNVVMEAWRMYNISAANRLAWFYSKDIPENPPFVYLENKPVRIQLLVENNEPTMISSVAPLSLKLGMSVFYIIKKEIDDSTENWRKLFIDEEGQPYKWLFYSKSFGQGKTYFNPEETLFENRVRSNTIIIAQRLG